jgi:endonuclease YncB( thermonuclease family)
MRGPRFALAIIAYTHGTNPSLAEPIEGQCVQVTDGDTVRVDGVRMRLVGCDAPEIGTASCDREREWGERAAARVRSLLEAGRIEIDDTGRRDRYRRPLVRLMIDGRDVCRLLIGERLAVWVSLKTRALD